MILRIARVELRGFFEHPRADIWMGGGEARPVMIGFNRANFLLAGRQFFARFFHFLAFAAALLCGCEARARPEEVPGTYVMNRGRAADTLLVRPSGTYVRRHVAPGGALVVDSGSWSIEQTTGEQRVAFEGFPARWRPL